MFSDGHLDRPRWSAPSPRLPGRERRHHRLARRSAAIYRRVVTEGEVSLQIFLYLRNLAFNSLASPSKSGNATESVTPRNDRSFNIDLRRAGSMS